MSCEGEKAAFDEAVRNAQAALQEDIKAVANDTESRTKELSDEFQNYNDLAQGVGAVAGTVIGGVYGGPVGAVAGEFVGKTVGALFTIKVRERLVEFALDLPEFSLRDQEMIFDLPEVSIRDSDIIFNVPTVVMKTVEGPPIPETVVEMVLECVDLGPLGKACSNVPHTTIRWKKTYLDIPSVENREQRIVVGLPQVTMKQQRVVIGVPQVTMKTQTISFSVPEIVIEFAKDAGKKVADEAKDIAADAAMLLAQKQASLKDRMRQELVTPANRMFDCHRATLMSARTQIAASFDTQLQTISNSIVSMKAGGVPDTHADLVKLQEKVAEITGARDAQLAKIDESLAALNEAAKSAIEKLVS